MSAELVFVDEHVPGIRWDAKYSTWDNFVGRPVDGYGPNRIAGTPALCAALRTAADHAARAGYGLLLWDGYRPCQAVECFLRWSREPEDGRTKARHYPRIDRADMIELGYVASRSGHSRGSTVDLTLYDARTREQVDMGGDHDLMDPRSHHGASGIGTDAALHRTRLRTIMEESGFSAYESEWWHYTLEQEPHPDTYFDVPIAAIDSACHTVAPGRRGRRLTAPHPVR